MITEDIFNNLKKKYGKVASWAIWKLPGDKPKSNTEDISIFQEKDILEKLNNKYVFVALNFAGTHGNEDNMEREDWLNFHSGYSRQNDFKLRYALMYERIEDPEEKKIAKDFWGSYITDLIKYHPDPNSNDVKKYLKNDPEILEKNIEIFKQEISLLSAECKPTLIALGDLVYSYLKKYLGKDYNIYKIKHYSVYMCKEKYRDHVLSVLSEKPINTVLNV